MPIIITSACCPCSMRRKTTSLTVLPVLWLFEALKSKKTGYKALELHASFAEFSCGVSLIKSTSLVSQKKIFDTFRHLNYSINAEPNHPASPHSAPATLCCTCGGISRGSC